MYNDPSNDAVNHSNQARRWLGTLEEPELNRLAWALPIWNKPSRRNQPTKLGDEHSSTPRPTIRIRARGIYGFLRAGCARCARICSAQHDIFRIWSSAYAEALLE